MKLKIKNRNAFAFRFLIFMLRQLDAFRTLNWNKIKRDLEESGVFGGSQELAFQNS